MSDTITRRMLDAYYQQPSVTRFLTGFFQSPAKNFHTTEEVEFDVIRSEEDIAIAVQDLSVGYRDNATELYTNKSFKPPVFKEKVSINAFDLIKRMPGQNPFESPNFRANAITRIYDAMTKVEQKIRRSIELQASQVLQTGTVTLSDAGGNALYTIDFKPKATHFPTAGTSWATATGAQKIADLLSLSEVVRDDGLSDPDSIIMGVDVFENFISDAEVQKRYDNRRIDLGTIAPMRPRGEGGNYRGIVEIGNYRYDIWTYGGRYKDPQTGSTVQYMDKGKVIVMNSQARFDATFGAIPNIGSMMGRGSSSLLPELPGRMSSGSRGMDMFVNAWLSNDGEQLFAGIGSRPLMIPTAIDTYGCLTTGL